MKKILIVTTVLFTIFSGVNSSFAIDGKEIMEKVKALKKPMTIIQSAVLLIVKGERRDVLKFDGIFKDYGNESRVRIMFKEGTSMEFLVVHEKGGGSTQWLKLSNGRIRQVPQGEKGNTWLNSHFYNVDIGGVTERQNVTYTLLGEGEVEGVPCYRIQGSGNPNGVYSSSILYVGKDDYIVRRVELFEKGKHTKTLILEKIENISGISTPRKITMERADGLGKSIIYIKSINYNSPVSDNELKRSGF